MVAPVTDPLLVLVVRIAVAFGIGALIGLERERSEPGGTFAGSRTFPLFALAGALVQAFFPTLLPVVVIALAAPLTVAYAAKAWLERDIGLTTLTAAILTILLGALTTHSAQGTQLAIVVGGVITVLLSAKEAIHGRVAKIDEDERRASIKFVLVVAVILPILPDRELAVLFGLNPRYVWLMVVFVAGLSFVAYVAIRIVGARRGLAATGVLGGFVSSTATAVSMARQAAATPALYRLCAFSTVIASIGMFPRALVEVAVVNPALLPYVAVPLGGMAVVGVLVAGVVYRRLTTDAEMVPEVDNPFRLRPALFFGAVFAVVLLVAEFVNSWFGASGVYVTAFVSGIASVNAITLTLSTLAAEGAIEPSVAATGIVIGAIANTLVKAALAWLLGTRQLGRIVTVILGVVSLTGIVLVVL